MLSAHQDHSYRIKGLFMNRQRRWCSRRRWLSCVRSDNFRRLAEKGVAHRAWFQPMPAGHMKDIHPALPWGANVFVPGTTLPADSAGAK
jgi:hypothetical protein